MLFVVIKLVLSPKIELIIGTLTMNHMTVTKIYTLENEELDVQDSAELISSLPNESAVKQLLRIGIDLID
jgi:hypothetical protein